jgi:hypothetical protein
MNLFLYAFSPCKKPDPIENACRTPACQMEDEENNPGMQTVRTICFHGTSVVLIWFSAAVNLPVSPRKRFSRSR